MFTETILDILLFVPRTVISIILFILRTIVSIVQLLGKTVGITSIILGVCLCLNPITFVFGIPAVFVGILLVLML